MCFSAPASFAVSGVLVLIGTFTIQKIKTKSQIPFASIPLFFALQQFVEGLLWLALARGITSDLIQAAAYIYLSFAFPFWPIWIPISLIFLEKNKLRRSFLILTLFIGAAVAGYLIYCMAKFRVTPQILSHHIYYDVKVPQITKYDYVFYLIATILPFLISSFRYMWVFGILAAASLFITYLLYTKFLLSVWCFFAAALSVIIYFITIKKKN